MDWSGRRMRSLVRTVPGFLPVVVLWTVIAILVSGRLAGFLNTRRIVAFGLVMSVGLILGATLSPTRIALDAGIASNGQCDLSRLGFASLAELKANYDPIINIALFVPLGFALGLLPRTRRNIAIILGAFSFTVLIELTQLLVPDLGRGCESADMIDNTVGLAIGLAAGMVMAHVQRLTTSG